MLTVDLIKRALNEADNECGDGPASRQLHARRSQRWVACLARMLVGNPVPQNVRVFTKYDETNKPEFGLNELLYDVCIVETDTCISAGNRKQLRYITRAIWQVESEFAADSSEAVKDFNKLVIGSAENKLFIGPHLSDATGPAYRSALLPVARRIPGVYLAHVPHPSEWRAERGDTSLWQLRNDEWVRL